MALASYERARAISQKLAEANPAVTQFQSDLAQSHNDIGFLHQESGHLAVALASLEQARAILQKLADANPAVTLNSRATWRRATRSSARSRIRPAIRQEALASYERARAILQRLADANPTLTLFQNRLAMSHSYVGTRAAAGGPARRGAPPSSAGPSPSWSGSPSSSPMAITSTTSPASGRCSRESRPSRLPG